MIKITKEEYINKLMKIKDITHESDDGTITNILAELSDEYGVLSSKLDQLELTKEKLTNDNESLRDTNMRLFLRVGENKDVPNAKDTQDKEIPSFESLFNEQGELK